MKKPIEMYIVRPRDWRETRVLAVTPALNYIKSLFRRGAREVKIEFVGKMERKRKND